MTNTHEKNFNLASLHITHRHDGALEVIHGGAPLVDGDRLGHLLQPNGHIHLEASHLLLLAVVTPKQYIDVRPKLKGTAHLRG